MRLQARLYVVLAAVILGFCATSLLARPAAQSSTAKGKTETYYYFVFSNPVAGQEAQYNKWYNEQHQLDVVAVPGFVTAQRFIFNDIPLFADAAVKLPKYLVIYKIVTDDLDAVFKEVSRRRQSGETKMDPSFGPDSIGYTYRALEPWYKGAGGEPATAKPGKKEVYWHLVFTPFIEGQEDLFNKVYTEEHVPGLANLPGYTGGLRLIMARPDTAAIKGTKYAALFTVETSDMQAMKAPATPRPRPATAQPRPAPRPSGQDFTNTRGYTYRAITAEVSGDKVRADRAAKK